MKIQETIKDLFQLIKNLMDLQFTGEIELHFNQGTIARVIKHERLN